MQGKTARIGIRFVLGGVLLGCGGKFEEKPIVRTIQVVEHANTDATTDNAPPGDSAGDILTFANALFDESNTRQVGTDQGYCVRVAVGQSYECMWTAFLEAGQLTVEGPFFDTRASTLALTGGTGAFNGARGQMRLQSRDPQGKEFNFIYEVLLNP